MKVKKLCTIILAGTVFISTFTGCSNNINRGSQELNFNLGVNPKTLDPALCSDSQGNTVVSNLFTGLVELDDNNKPKPAQAESWNISEDGLTYTFHLKDGLKWSNGDNVKASDYEYEWKRVLDPDTASDYAYQLFYIDGATEYNSNKGNKEDVKIKAIDDKTLEVKLKIPTSYFLELLAESCYFAVPQKVVENNSEWANNASTYVCDGAFKLTDYAIKDRIILERNENYFDKDKVKLNKINIGLTSDEESSWAGYTSGQFDMVNTVPKSEIEESLENGNAKKFNQLGTYYLSINVKDTGDRVKTESEKALSNSKIREALNLSIDRQMLVDKVTKAGQIPAHGIVGKGIVENDGKDFVDYKKYIEEKSNVEKAKKDLEEAGYPNGEGLPTIKLLYNPEGNQGVIMEALQDMWKQVGINVELQSQEFKTYLDTRGKGAYEITRDGWSADYIDPMTFLDLFTSGSPQNTCGYENSHYDELVSSAKSERDDDKRYKIMHDAEDTLMSDSPIIPLYYYNKVIGIKDYVKDVKVSSLNFINFKHTYIEE